MLKNMLLHSSIYSVWKKHKNIYLARFGSVMEMDDWKIIKGSKLGIVKLKDKKGTYGMYRVKDR